MTERQRALSLQTAKLQLSFWGKVSHFGIVGFLLLIPLISLIFRLDDTLSETRRPFKDGELYILLIPTLLAAVFYKMQSYRLRFKVLNTSLSKQQLSDIIENVGKELKWHPEQIDVDYLVAKTYPSFFSGSWGEQITILIDENRILVNSICDPGKSSSVVSMGRNSRNVNRLIGAIQHASR